MEEALSSSDDYYDSFLTDLANEFAARGNLNVLKILSTYDIYPNADGVLKYMINRHEHVLEWIKQFDFLKNIIFHKNNLEDIIYIHFYQKIRDKGYLV